MQQPLCGGPAQATYVSSIALAQVTMLSSISIGACKFINPLTCARIVSSPFALSQVVSALPMSSLETRRSAGTKHKNHKGIASSTGADAGSSLQAPLKEALSTPATPATEVRKRKASKSAASSSPLAASNTANIAPPSTPGYGTPVATSINRAVAAPGVNGTPVDAPAVPKKVSRRKSARKPLADQLEAAASEVLASDAVATAAALAAAANGIGTDVLTAAAAAEGSMPVPKPRRTPSRNAASASTGLTPQPSSQLTPDLLPDRQFSSGSQFPAASQVPESQAVPGSQAVSAMEGVGVETADGSEPKKARKTRKPRGEAAAAAAAEGEAGTQGANGEDGRKPAKPVKAIRRTKAVVAAEVREAAEGGLFAEHVNLHITYPHSAQFVWSPGREAPVTVGVVLDTVDTAGIKPEPSVLGTGLGIEETRSSSQYVVEHSGTDPAVPARMLAMMDAVGDAGASAAGSAAEVLPAVSAAAAVERQGGDLRQHSSEATGDIKGAVPMELDAGAGSSKPAAAFTAASDTAAIDCQLQAGADSAVALHGTAVVATLDTLMMAASQLPDALAPAAAAVSPAVLPNLGYACLNATLRAHNIFCSRDTNKAGFQSKGLSHVSGLALANARDLALLIEWNEAHNIRFFRISSCVFPWMSKYDIKELPDYEAIVQAFADAGARARKYGHRLTFHPSEFTKIASDKPKVVECSVLELEVHSAMLDLLGLLPATPFNKINIHMGGVYGDKITSMERFAEVFRTRLSPNCRARLTVENDDRPSMYSVSDLMYLHKLISIPIVFDFHHHKFCTGGLSEEEAFRLALSTWPPGIRPVVHWSESQRGRRPHAHSDYVNGPIYLYGKEQEVDVMMEAKAKEFALLHYREAALSGRPCVRPPLPDADEDEGMVKEEEEDVKEEEGVK